MSDNNKIELLSNHRDLDRSLTPQELVHELQNIVNRGEYNDFMVVFFSDKGRGWRFASTKERDEFDTSGIMSLMLNIALKDLMNF